MKSKYQIEYSDGKQKCIFVATAESFDDAVDHLELVAGPNIEIHTWRVIADYIADIKNALRVY